MTTALWEWAKEKGYAYRLGELANKLGYTSPRYVEQLLRNWTPLTDAFRWKFTQAFPEDGRRIFLPTVSDESDIMSGDGDGDA